MDLNIYLLFNGNAEDAMNFYKDAIGGTIDLLTRFGESPVPSDEADKDKILHGIMTIQGSTVMFSDSNNKNRVTVGNNFSVSINCHSNEDVTRYFDAMSKGGVVTLPLQDMFWGAKFGMCTDKFGVNWMFNYDKPKA
jgi:PhnB protein